jgi:hypothetical protein
LSSRDGEGQGLITRIEANVDNVKATSKRVYTGIDSVGIGNQVLDCAIEIETEVMTKASVERTSIGVPVTSTLGPNSGSVSICRGSNSQKISSSLLHNEGAVLKKVGIIERVTQMTEKKVYQDMESSCYILFRKKSHMEYVQKTIPSLYHKADRAFFNIGAKRCFGLRFEAST